jgi:hypothetical protein
MWDPEAGSEWKKALFRKSNTGPRRRSNWTKGTEKSS